MEMVSAKAIYYNNKNTELLMEIHPEEKPVSLQLFGSDPDIISEMAKKIEEKPFDILDINMGCPVPKVVNNGEGSALMKNPKLVEEILTKTVKAIQKPALLRSPCMGGQESSIMRARQTGRSSGRSKRRFLFRSSGMEILQTVLLLLRY